MEVKCLNTLMKYGTGGIGAFLNVHIQISSGFCDGNFDNQWAIWQAQSLSIYTSILF